MSADRIPVDLRNPGQVFACLGLMELTELLSGPATGRYEWVPGATSAWFELTAPSDHPVAYALAALRTAEVGVWTLEDHPPLAALEGGSLIVEQTPGWSFPFPPPNSRATLPARLRMVGVRGPVDVPVEHWGDDRAAGRDNVKFWAGMAGYAGAELLRDALALVQAQSIDPADPFRSGTLQDSSFRFDWRQSYVALKAGFSVNNHGTRIRTLGFPLVDVLAAIGLQHARPARPDPRDKLVYRYAVSSAALPTTFARAALGAAELGFPLRRFRITLDWPGKEGQARCITDTTEETA